MESENKRNLEDYKFEEFNSETNFIKIVDRFMETHPVHYDSSMIWWVWNHTHFCWDMLDETDILCLIDQSTKNPSVNSRMKTELLEAFRRRGRLNKPIPKEKTWIQFKDRIIDVSNNSEFKATPKYFITNPIPWEIGESEDTPIMDKIFKEWVGEDYVPTLYEIIAYCLLPYYPIQRLFCFIGSGLNGKSSYLELVKKFIGKTNYCSTEMERLMHSRFESSGLHHKLVCFMGETDFNEMGKTSILKQLTGNDAIPIEFKRKDPFYDVNYAKILISTNNLPPTSDKSVGFYRRWLIIDFANKFSEKKDILDEIPEVEYNNLARKSIRILTELLKRREFHMEGTIEDRQKRFEEKSNPLEKFMTELVEEDVNGHIFKFEFRKKLDDWCKDNGFRTLTDSFIGRKMKEIGVDTQKIYAEWYNNEGEKPRYNAWVGIKWKEKPTFPMELSMLSGLSSKSHLISHMRKLSGNRVDNPSNMDTEKNQLKIEEEEIKI